jgi:tRNA-2-methylthio-N6-dimethylallyladenosine synthase
MVAVAGCVAQAEGEEIIRRAPVVDVVIGPQTYHRLPEALARARNGEASSRPSFPPRTSSTDCPRRAGKSHPRPRRGTPSSPCRKAATSSAPSASCPTPAGPRSPVPSTGSFRRGRTPGRAGVREITLLGQNVNAWHGQGADGREWGLGELVRRLATIDGLDRIRYTTSHPRDMDDALINAAPRSARTDALPASAGAGRFGPHPQGHEPPPHRCRVCPNLVETHPRRPPGHRAVR